MSKVTILSRREGKSMVAYILIEHLLSRYEHALVCCADPVSGLTRLRQRFPNNIMEVVPNAGIRVYRKKFK